MSEVKKPVVKKDPPHVANVPVGGQHGVYDVPVKTVSNETDGHHSGRKVPAATPHKELDK